MKKLFCFALVTVLLLGVLTGCDTASPDPVSPSSEPVAQTDAPASAEPIATAEPEPVTLTVAGSWPDCRAIEAVGREFTAKYPNCTVVYEYLQDYSVSIEKRMSGEDAVDVFFTTNIQSDSPLLPYALDLNSCEELDLSNTFDGLIENFTFREEGDAPAKLYAIPLGAEMRGLYVNLTLLESVGLSLPTDQASLLAACETLKQNGYIAFHGNPGDFAQSLMYPWVCNLIANAEDPVAAYEKVAARESGVSELFREPFAFLYTLVENDYYNYKFAQTEYNLFNDTTSESYAKYLLNIVQNGDNWEKAEGPGLVAFMPSPMSMQGIIAKTKDDYHSEIEYAFIPAPTGPDGGFAYLSPAHGIALNNASTKLEWSVRFMDFLFQPEYNKLFADEFDIIPNTEEAFDYIRTLYDIPDERISHLGQITFDYDFYNTVITTLRDVSKANNPKYMQANADGSTTLYPLDYYMSALETGFQTNE